MGFLDDVTAPDWRTCELATIAVKLGPPLPTTLTLEMYDGDADELARDVATDNASAVRYVDALTFGRDIFDADCKRARFPCPSCEVELLGACYRWLQTPGDSPAPASGSLILERTTSPDTVRARCLQNCSSKKIGDAIAKFVELTDAKARKREADEREAEIIAQCSIAGKPRKVKEWIVGGGMLPARNLTLLGGASGARKTLGAMSLALSVASGRHWNDEFEVKRGRALLVLLEGSEEDRDRYLDGLAAGLGTTIEECGDQIMVYPYDLKVDDPTSFARFLKFVAVLKPLVIVADNLVCLGSNTAQGSAYDPAVMSTVLKPLADIAQGRMTNVAATAVLLLAHTNKSGEVRGADMVKSHIDHTLYMEADSDDNDSTITLYRGKSRSGEEFDPIVFKFVGKGPAPITLERVRPPRDRGEVEDDPNRSDAERRAMVLKLLPLAPQKLYDAMTDCGRSTTKRLRDALEHEGLIVKREDGRYHRVGE